MKPSTRPKCRRCNRPLTAVYASHEVRTEQAAVNLDAPGVPLMNVYTRTVRDGLIGYGYAAKGTFCSLTCGFWWATDRIKEGNEPV